MERSLSSSSSSSSLLACMAALASLEFPVTRPGPRPSPAGLLAMPPGWALLPPLCHFAFLLCNEATASALFLSRCLHSPAPGESGSPWGLSSSRENTVPTPRAVEIESGSERSQVESAEICCSSLEVLGLLLGRRGDRSPPLVETARRNLRGCLYRECEEGATRGEERSGQTNLFIEGRARYRSTSGSHKTPRTSSLDAPLDLLGGVRKPPSTMDVWPRQPHRADQKEIKGKFRKLALKYHPDKFRPEPSNSEAKNELLKKKHNDRFIQIQGAYDILSDQKKKNAYDKYGQNGLDMLEKGLDPEAQGFGGGFGGVDPEEEASEGGL
ncbi:hypothetical protein THAOC_19298, partial [Thalassiosira oceanica]